MEGEVSDPAGGKSTSSFLTEFMMGRSGSGHKDSFLEQARAISRVIPAATIAATYCCSSVPFAKTATVHTKTTFFEENRPDFISPRVATEQFHFSCLNSFWHWASPRAAPLMT